MKKWFSRFLGRFRGTGNSTLDALVAATADFGKELPKIILEDALAAYKSKDYHRAISQVDELLQLFDPSLKNGTDREILNTLSAHGIKAVSLRTQLPFPSVNSAAGVEMASTLAMACAVKAESLEALGNMAAAVPLFAHGAALVERLVDDAHKTGLRRSLATGLVRLGRAVGNTGDHQAAVSHFDKAIGVLEHLQASGASPHFDDNLVDAYSCKAFALGYCGDQRAALVELDKAIAIRHRMVFTDAKVALTLDLALLEARHAAALLDVGENAKGVEEMRLAIGVLEVEVARIGRTDLEQQLLGWRQRLAADSGGRPKTVVTTRNPGIGALPPAAAGREWTPGHDLLSDFVIESVLGEGGMGTVHLVKSRSTGSRFAVKRALYTNQEARRSFLAELRTWADLPLHINLVACRFFRTLGDEVLIFAEYVSGGSLKERIESRALYEGDPQKVLERMLDIAIQFAWGLRCVHALGILHQDVKPGNVLLSDDGAVKIADFGLARARLRAGEVPASNTGVAQSACVPGRGLMTREFASPEQIAGKPLSRKTDLWSWGVSVLQMFTGELSWHSGDAAPEVLQIYEVEGSRLAGIPRMPTGLGALLRGCFQRDPDARPSGFGQVVEALKATFQEFPCKAYSRDLYDVKRSPHELAAMEARSPASGEAWDPPKEWLERALRAAGRNPSEAEGLLSRIGTGRLGHLVGDVSIYDEAKRIYESLLREQRNEVRRDLANVCMNKAILHRTAGDFSGALRECDQAVSIWERLTAEESSPGIVYDLLRTYNLKANVLRQSGDYQAALVLFHRSLGTFERLSNRESQREVTNLKAATYMNKGLTLQSAGDIQAAVVAYDQAIDILKLIVKRDGHQEMASDLAGAYMNKAAGMVLLGASPDAVELFDHAIGIWEGLASREASLNLLTQLARALMNKATALSKLGSGQALSTCDRSIEMWERIVSKEGHGEFLDELARALMNKGIAAKLCGDTSAAISLYDRSRSLFEQLVNQDGRHDLVDDLARIYMNKAILLVESDQTGEALPLLEKATRIWCHLVNETGRAELKDYLIQCEFYTDAARRGRKHPV